MMICPRCKKEHNEFCYVRNLYVCIDCFDVWKQDIDEVFRKFKGD